MVVNGTDFSGNSSLNATGFSIELYPGSLLVQFFFLTLPTIILCIIAVIAITKAQTTNWKFKIILINIFGTEIYFSAGMTLILLGFRIRLLIDDNPTALVIALCKITISTIIASGLAKILSIALYSVTTYFFIKTNIKKIKWYAIILPLIIIWVFSLGFSFRAFLVPAFIPRVFVYRGFCSVDLENANVNATGFLVQLVVAWILDGGIGAFILTFLILTYCYIKKNTLASGDEIKKAIAKNLIYLTGGAFFTITNAVVIPTIVRFASFAPDISNLQAAITQLVISDFIINILRSLSSLYIPIVTITLLKAVRVALKQCLVPKFQSHPKVVPQPPTQTTAV